MSVVVCTEPLAQHPHSHVGMGRLLTAGSLGGLTVSNRWQTGPEEQIGGFDSQSLRTISHLLCTHDNI